MIHRIDHTDAAASQAGARKQHTGKASEGKRSFAEVHAAALTQGTDKAAPEKQQKATRHHKATGHHHKAHHRHPHADRTATRSERGERLQPVEGHEYSHIMSGRRNGMELNTSGNVRDGEAFVIVHRDDRTFHVYDIDGEHQVFEIK